MQTLINSKGFAFLGFLFATLLCHTGTGQTIVEAEPTTTVDVKEISPNVGIGLEKCFERLRFQRPILLTHAGDGSDRIFILE